MSDQIGDLGLRTAEFDAATDRAISQLTELGKEAALVTGNLLAMAAVAGGVLAKGIYDSRQRAKELEETLRHIENSNPFGDKLTSLGEFEAKLKSINAEIKKLDDGSIGDRIFDFIGSAHLVGGEGFDAKLEEMENARIRFAKEYEDTLKAIGQRQRENTQVLQLQLDKDEQGATLLKIHLEYREKIGKAIKDGNGDLAVALRQEELITQELAKQVALNKTKFISQEDTKDFDKQKADDNDAFDKEKAEKKAAREKTLRQDNADFQKQLQEDDDEFAKGKDAELQKTAKTYEQIEASRKRANADDRKQRSENDRINSQVQNDLTVQDLARRGNKTSANKERQAQEDQKKILDAVRRGDTEGEDLARKEANVNQADFDVAEAQKTPSDRRAERAAGRKRESDEVKAKQQKDDLDKRIDDGARGDKDSRIEQRREERDREKQRGQDTEDARNGKVPEPEKGYGQTDRQYLKGIYDALQPKN